MFLGRNPLSKDVSARCDDGVWAFGGPKLLCFEGFVAMPNHHFVCLLLGLCWAVDFGLRLYKLFCRQATSGLYWLYKMLVACLQGASSSTTHVACSNSFPLYLWFISHPITADTNGTSVMQSFCCPE